jgi:hypothetical protein
VSTPAAPVEPITLLCAKLHWSRITGHQVLCPLLRGRLRQRQTRLRGDRRGKALQPEIIVATAGPLDAVPMASPAQVQDTRTMLDAPLAWLGDAPDG